MITSLALTVALAAPGACLQVEIATHGRGAHGSTVMPWSAPHRLIRALDRLPAWTDSAPAVHAARITQLDAAAAVNIIPDRASAVVEIDYEAGRTTVADLLGNLAETVGPRVEVERRPASCVARQE